MGRVIVSGDIEPPRVGIGLAVGRDGREILKLKGACEHSDRRLTIAVLV